MSQFQVCNIHAVQRTYVVTGCDHVTGNLTPNVISHHYVISHYD